MEKVNLLSFIHNAPEGSSFKIDVVPGFDGPIKFLRNCKTKEKCAVPPPSHYTVAKVYEAKSAEIDFSEPRGEQ